MSDTQMPKDGTKVTITLTGWVSRESHSDYMYKVFSGPDMDEQENFFIGVPDLTDWAYAASGLKPGEVSVDVRVIQEPKPGEVWKDVRHNNLLLVRGDGGSFVDSGNVFYFKDLELSNYEKLLNADGTPA